MSATGMRPCRNKTRLHAHGDYAHYVKCGCRCTPCKTTGSRFGKRDRYRRATGRTAYTPAAPIREHLETVLASGLTVMQIVRTSGVNSTAVRRVLGIQLGHPASKGVRPATARALLAVEPAPATTLALDGGLASNIGTRRRLQALATLGWSISEIARRADLDRQPLDRALRTDAPVNARTAATVARTYDQLWNTPAPPDPYATRARNRAARQGWAPPMAWDDHTIDLPSRYLDYTARRRTQRDDKETAA